MFAAGVEGSDREYAPEILVGIEGIFDQLCAEGIDSEVLHGIVDRIEMTQKDITGDSYPYGLQLLA